MTLGKGIAITGIWICAIAISIALSLSGVGGEVAAEHPKIIIGTPAVVAAGVTYFMLI